MTFTKDDAIRGFGIFGVGGPNELVANVVRKGAGNVDSKFVYGLRVVGGMALFNANS